MVGSRSLSVLAYAGALLLALMCFSAVPGADARPAKKRPCHAERNFRTVSSIYNLTVYPNQLSVVGSNGFSVPPGLFSKNVVGRVNPVGKFTDFENSIEYFWALSPIPDGSASGAAITSYRIVEFSSQCASVAASVVYLYCSVVRPGSPDHGRPLPPIRQIAFWRFDKTGAVVKYDAWISNLNSWVEATNGAPLSDPQFRAGTIQQVCRTTMERCRGPNAQWGSFDECVDALSSKPYGTYDNAWADNVVCRTIHLVLTGVRPDVHCPHVGPTGGGKCIDVPYPENYFSDEALYGDPVGETFSCDY
ncbi:hypothetical protein VTJ83DRAFT_3125 [Remersonia thermophila]|uniref:Uncharacterized protein n=1 Tax=Remersonia thermophila TaxID=72144 RepID=A0ABR4DE16_9PEZI